MPYEGQTLQLFWLDTFRAMGACSTALESGSDSCLAMRVRNCQACGHHLSRSTPRHRSKWIVGKARGTQCRCQENQRNLPTIRQDFDAKLEREIMVLELYSEQQENEKENNPND